MFEWCSLFITKYVRENIVYIFIAVLTIFKKSAENPISKKMWRNNKWFSILCIATLSATHVHSITNKN